MESVKDRIAKLLALAESPNENEAKLALLRTKELMAQHKLSVDDVQRLERQKVVGTSGKQIRQMCNAYGLGFCEGLQSAYAKQEQEHTEWALALALTTPQSVRDAMKDVKPTRSIFDQEVTQNTVSFWMDGVTEGEGVDPTTRVKEGKKVSDLLCE